jgi:PKD repeat protein
MKQLLFFVCAVFFSINGIAQESLKYCGADEMRISTLKQNPKIAQAVIKRDAELESFTKQFVSDFYNKQTSSATYIIPVVFHVIHNYGSENISDAQILDGLDILNKTFRKQLADTGSIVSVFKPLHADCDIEFRLAKLDPDGNCTSGINRIASPLTTIGDHSVKSLIHWDPHKYLNIYIVANAAGLAGHCVWPSDADSIPAWDGIVVGYNYIGSIGTSTYTQSVALAHECGHYLNLQHIWGGNNVPNFYYYPCADPNKDCSIDDLVADTPPTIGWLSCNLSGASCGNTVDNVQNAMDYSYCNRMFTYGQKARMQACLNSPIAGRNNLWQTANLIATGVLNAPASLCKADFTSNKNVVCQTSPNTITFTNNSYNGAFTGVLWTFPGGTPDTSTASSPVVTYTTPGKHDVTLKVINGNDSVIVTKPNYISVLSNTGNPYPYTESFESTTSLDGLEWLSNSFDTVNKWELTNAASYSGTKSVMLNNYANNMSTKDELYSKIINLSGATSMNISFKYACAQRDTANSDRLQLYMTNNCSTWIQRINLVSPALETAPVTTTSFVPANTGQWKQASASIPGTYLTSNFRFKFVYSSNGGNNVYIDDVNLDVNAGVADLEDINTTFQLFPNPANENVNIVFTLAVTKKLNISILNVLGQAIYETGRETYSDGSHSVSLNIKDVSAGMYFVKVSDGVNDVKKRPMIISN